MSGEAWVLTNRLRWQAISGWEAVPSSGYPLVVPRVYNELQQMEQRLDTGEERWLPVPYAPPQTQKESGE